MTDYWRPLLQSAGPRPGASLALAGGPLWFDHVLRLSRGAAPERVPVSGLPADIVAALTAVRGPVAGVAMSAPQVMGILNVTPDSFSDGGDLADLDTVVDRARGMAAAGATLLDVGGESTRPGADVVSVAEEIARTAPAIHAIRADMPDMAISIDTRKAAVAQAAVDAGAGVFNDVSALSYDPDSLAVAAELAVPVCLMHAQGTPKSMQAAPQYEDVLLDVFDYLQDRRDAAVAAGVRPENIILDPGIGFGKTVEHNLALLRGLSLFHSLGHPLLLGASRKRFIGTLTGTGVAKDRMAGSVAVALHGARQGAQILRVHDVAETAQALVLDGHLAG